MSTGQLLILHVRQCVTQCVAYLFSREGSQVRTLPHRPFFPRFSGHLCNDAPIRSVG